jgi:2-succinyl-5-enolpyruvyl-6-hydroxy-3-cyclohexene-1-carboxylate synthase
MKNLLSQDATCRLMVDIFETQGLKHAVISPGSRSTPIVRAFIRTASIKTHVKLDERSAAFYGLGIAKITDNAVAIITTSGTAATEVFSAIVEANYAKVPLILLTADRPSGSENRGEAQSIRQFDLYKNFCRYEISIDDMPELDRAVDIFTQAYAFTHDGPKGPGPVHINLRFTEPLMGPDDDSLVKAADPRSSFEKPIKAANDTLIAENLDFNKDCLVVVTERVEHSKQFMQVTAALRWPVIGEARSNLRKYKTLCFYDAFCRSAEFKSKFTPRQVIRYGTDPISKSTASYLGELVSSGTKEYVLDPYKDKFDPKKRAAAFFNISIEEFCMYAIQNKKEPDNDAFYKEIHALDNRLKESLMGFAEENPHFFNPNKLLDAMGKDAILFCSSSLPIRYLDAFTYWRLNYPVIVVNRGANGIDGIISTAFGVKAGVSNKQVVCLTGDLSFLYDLSAHLKTKTDIGDAITIVLLDNGGGNIFSLLEQKTYLEEEEFIRYFLTPPLIDYESLCKAFGITYIESDVNDLSADLLRNESQVKLIKISLEPKIEQQTYQELQAYLSESANQFLAH